MIMKLLVASMLACLLVVLNPIAVDAQKNWEKYTVEAEYSFSYPSNWDLASLLCPIDLRNEEIFINDAERNYECDFFWK